MHLNVTIITALHQHDTARITKSSFLRRLLNPVLSGIARPDFGVNQLILL